MEKADIICELGYKYVQTNFGAGGTTIQLLLPYNFSLSVSLS